MIRRHYFSLVNKRTFCMCAITLLRMVDIIHQTQAFSSNIFRPMNKIPVLVQINGALNAVIYKKGYHSEISEIKDNISLTIHNRKKLYEQRKKEWTIQSLNYYTKVMRDNTGRESAAIDLLLDQNSSRSGTKSITRKEDEEQLRNFVGLAKRHYFARQKIKNFQPRHAERIYRKIIDEIIENRDSEEEHCDHAALAVSTLLLALHLQRQGDVKGARSVFNNFFRTVFVNGNAPSECKCSAKVLQAYALFEMKRGNQNKGLELIRKAISLDASLTPVLRWKQFQNVKRCSMQP